MAEKVKTITFNGTAYTCTLSERFRRHTPDELERMRASIRESRVRVAIRVYRDTDLELDNCILDGEGRLGIAAELGLGTASVPFFLEPRMSTDEAFALAKTLNDCRRHDDADAIRKRRTERIERVAEARSEGKSLRAIAAVEKVSPEQVRQDLKAATVKGLTVETPLKIEGLDGRERPATRPAPVAEVEEQEAEDEAEQSEVAPVEPVEHPPVEMREYPKHKPPGQAPGGSKVDPDHPYADVLAAMTNLTRLVTLAINDAADGGKLRQTLALHSKTLRRTLMVEHIGGKYQHGEHHDAVIRFVGLRPLRALIRQVGKSVKPLTAKQIEAIFDEANTIDAKEGDQ